LIAPKVSLSNRKKFVSNAPAEVIEKEQAKLTDFFNARLQN